MRFQISRKYKNLKLLPRVPIKYFLKASIGKDVAPNKSDRLVLKLCKSDQRYGNYNGFYKSVAYGPLRNSLTEERHFWSRNILTNEWKVFAIQFVTKG